MTWQRIDENTYIDDTLVTCAEYQLFIDEMREQGKDYQPDHWPSNRYLTGDAREPIIGLRFYDAQNFCEWLTKKDIGEWKFRLPTSEEALTYPIITKKQLVFLYWTYDFQANSEFGWIGTIPTDGEESAREGMRLVKERTR